MDTTIIYQEFTGLLIKYKTDKRKKRQLIFLSICFILVLLLVLNKSISKVVFIPLVVMLCLISLFVFFNIFFGKPIQLNKIESDLCMVETKRIEEKYIAITKEKKILKKELELSKKELEQAKESLWKVWSEKQYYNGGKVSRKGFNDFYEKVFKIS